MATSKPDDDLAVTLAATATPLDSNNTRYKQLVDSLAARVARIQ